jgi:hypothetical protein
MLIRILADNPGKTFTRNIDSKFVQVVKELLRVGRDPSVKQILMETLDTFSREKSGDDGLIMLNEMWKKEHERMIKLHVSNITSLIVPQLIISGPSWISSTTSTKRSSFRPQSTAAKLLRPKSPFKEATQSSRTVLPHRRSPNFCQIALPSRTIYPSLRTSTK